MKRRGRERKGEEGRGRERKRDEETKTNNCTDPPSTESLIRP